MKERKRVKKDTQKAKVCGFQGFVIFGSSFLCFVLFSEKKNTENKWTYILAMRFSNHPIYRFLLVI